MTNILETILLRNLLSCSEEADVMYLDPYWLEERWKLQEELSSEYFAQSSHREKVKVGFVGTGA